MFFALPLGDDHRHDLAPSRDQIGEKACLGVAQRSDFRRGRLDEMGDDQSVDRIGLGPFANCVGEGAHLCQIDHDDWQASARQSGGDEALEASGCLQPSRSRLKRPKPFDKNGKSLRVAGDNKTFVPAANMHIQLVLRNVDADNGGVHPIPSLRKRASLAAQATVRVRWNGWRRPLLTYGLGVPEALRSPTSHCASHYARSGGIQVTRRCRDVAIRAASSIKSHGVIYHALQMVVVAFDGAAHVITGQPYYFSEGGTGPSESERARTERQAAFERGEGEL